MTTYSKLNFIYRLQKWMDSVPGQTFLNYAYSWGASIVILGTLFKLTHLPGANFFLFLGMGTEVFVFFLAAFDRPFDKTTDGMDLELHPGEEQPSTGAVAGGGTVIINGGGVVGGVVGSGDEAARWEGQPISFGGGGGAVVAGGGAPGAQVPADMAEDLKDATSNYVDELNRLTEMLQKVSEQSERLTRDSEEMENLNRTLTGISRVYEMQLKSASSQISTIDEINAQTRHMAEQIVELNKIYARMIEAMQAKVS
ncbi:MAG: gliding motility protein GldL [Prevotella sp.]|nr:gliding motility protein GldL [Prevotella sp.]MBQ3360955.1 gliding motility protein GldL [Prevotella sp.]MBR1412370.1 gliding motility protein GldL [Prevotella sp.]